MRSGDKPDGMSAGQQDRSGGTLFRLNGSARPDGGPPFRGDVKKTPGRSSTDWPALMARLQAQLADDRLTELATGLRLPAEAVRALSPGYATTNDLRGMRAGGDGWRNDPPPYAFAFPERDGSGTVVGLGLRAPDGRKGFPKGAKRGLTVPATLGTLNDPVLIVEGPSDVAACEALGRAAVGRPNCNGGAKHLLQLLKGRAVLIVGENDQKKTGAWPGRDGAVRVARSLANFWQETIAWTLPPVGSKDIRSWCATQDLLDASSWNRAGAELLTTLSAATKEQKPERVSDAERVVRLAHKLYRIGMAEGGEPFAVAIEGPNVAMMFRGSLDALRSSLAREFRKTYGRVPGASALSDALMALRGEALEVDPEPVHLRLAKHDDAIILDLGDSSGRCVVIEPGRWDVRDGSPVLFRRTALTGALPEPERGGNLVKLRELLNVTDESWEMVVGWLVALFLPLIPHPILALFGTQGTGKSSAARLLVSLVDPSPVPLRSPPKDLEGWILAAAGSWVVALDNISSIPVWLSDALCKSVTGEGLVRRRLYTDGELSVTSFRRVVALTSIDAGALRGDLADRLLVVDLERIEDEDRREECEMDERFAALRPELLGAILDLVAEVLVEAPKVELTTRPRMADFARILAAVDSVLGTGSLPFFLAQRDRIAGDVIEADPIGEAIRQLVTIGPFSGSATELLKRIRPENAGREWPKNGRGLSGRLRRIIPALQSIGIGVSFDKAPGGNRNRIISIQTVPTVPTAPDATLYDSMQTLTSICEDAVGTEGGTVDSGGGVLRPELSEDRPEESAASCDKTRHDTKVRDGRDDRDGSPLEGSGDGLANVPDGWTAVSWSEELLRRAGLCESLNPAQAMAFRTTAAKIEKKNGLA